MLVAQSATVLPRQASSSRASLTCVEEERGGRDEKQIQLGVGMGFGSFVLCVVCKPPVTVTIVDVFVF